MRFSGTSRDGFVEALCAGVMKRGRADHHRLTQCGDGRKKGLAAPPVTPCEEMRNVNDLEDASTCKPSRPVKRERTVRDSVRRAMRDLRVWFCVNPDCVMFKTDLYREQIADDTAR